MVDEFAIGATLMVGHALRGALRGCFAIDPSSKPYELSIPAPSEGPDTGLPLRMTAARTGAVTNPHVAYQWPLARPEDWLVARCTDAAVADLMLRHDLLTGECRDLYQPRSHDLAVAAGRIWRAPVTLWGRMFIEAQDAPGPAEAIYLYATSVVEGRPHPADDGAAMAHRWMVTAAIPAVTSILSLWEALPEDKRRGLVDSVSDRLASGVSA